VPPDLAAHQRAGLATLRAERDQAAVDAALAGLVEAARSDESAMPAIIEAVDAEATLGEICGALRQVFGDYRPAMAAQI
jgi:methylmalonyl-CoA mutase N-terminal domain/subunit